MKKRLLILLSFVITALIIRFAFVSFYQKELTEENPPVYSEYYYDENGDLIKE